MQDFFRELKNRKIIKVGIAYVVGAFVVMESADIVFPAIGLPETAITLFIGITGSIAAITAGEHYWTLGLSGIVMGMMGLFAYLLTKGKIKCYYFFFIIFGSIAIPGWMLAVWYIGGYLFGLAFLREIRKDAAHIQETLR